MSSRFRALLLVLAVSAVSFTAGCSDTGTPVDAAPARMTRTGTTTTTTSTDFVAEGNLDILARFRVKPQITIAWAKAWIGPEGGRVDFQGFTIVVPAGAVDKVTMFTIRLPVDPNGSERVVAEFGPHNVPFAKPVTIGLPVRGTTVEGNTAAHVVWWDGAWVNMGGGLSADGSQILTQTPHFSQYGLTAERGGTLSASGG
jgi:hypothetical protein